MKETKNTDSGFELLTPTSRTVIYVHIVPNLEVKNIR